MTDFLQTRCPHCQTVFRVNETQLAVRDGRVRCGHCQRVFDGRLAIVGEAAETAGAGARTAAPRMSSPQGGAGAGAGKSPVDLIAHSVERVKDRPGPPRSEPPEDLEPPVMVAEEDPEWLKNWKPEALETLFPEPAVESSAAAAARAPKESSASQRPAPKPAPEGRSAGSSAEPARKPARGSREEHPITVQREPPGLGAPGPFAWEDKTSRKKRSWLWGALIPVLALALALQAAYQLRHTLAARVPVLKPYLVAACARIGCRVEPPRSRDQVSIEASDLQADPAHRGLLVLTATLRNRADFAVAYPHMELTLTDLQDRAVVRRVLAPSEYAGGTVQITSGIAPNGELAVKLFIDASATEQQGYRLVLFYP